MAQEKAREAYLQYGDKANVLIAAISGCVDAVDGEGAAYYERAMYANCQAGITVYAGRAEDSTGYPSTNVYNTSGFHQVQYGPAGGVDQRYDSASYALAEGLLTRAIGVSPRRIDSVLKCGGYGTKETCESKAMKVECEWFKKKICPASECADEDDDCKQDDCEETAKIIDEYCTDRPSAAASGRALGFGAATGLILGTAPLVFYRKFHGDASIPIKLAFYLTWITMVAVAVLVPGFLARWQIKTAWLTLFIFCFLAVPIGFLMALKKPESFPCCSRCTAESGSNQANPKQVSV